MEFVRGTNLERTLEGQLAMPRALAIVDDLLAGLDAMHKVQIAHLDVKPANVVLRDATGDAVLVDFGLAGRRVRPGCGSAHYCAAEVWTDAPPGEPFATDVYAAACVAFEVLTNRVLMTGDELQQVIDQHFAKQPGDKELAPLERDRRFAPLVQLLRVALSRDPKRRPTAARFRAGFAAIAPELRALPWPLR
jgi:eukaryotic-like serine/threonine-protein kinase